MKIFHSICVCFLLLLTGSLSAKTWFVSNIGNDTNSGMIDSPFATIMRAQSSVVAGDTVYIRGGTYTMTESQIALKSGIWAYMNYMDKSGTSAKRICYWAYPGEQPIIDMSKVKPANYRVIVFYVKGSSLHFKGLEITGTQVTITAHTQSECFRNEGGSNNIYEQCSMHDGMAIGFYLTKGSGNLVLNCDAYRNWDSVSENGAGGNVDGFGGHPNNTSRGNVFRGCRAWFNSDDGFDCISAYESIIFENCWAFYNGYTSAFVSKGDGNGFKIGGFGQAPVVSGLPDTIPSHTVQFCLAYRNKANGFYANHQVVAGSYWYNNTAYRNSTNFNMLSQKITQSSKTRQDTTIDCPGINHILQNNLSFKYSSQRDTLNFGTSLNTFNSFSKNSGVTVDANDFLSTDESLLISARKSDGSLPNVNFLKLKSGSDLIDKGKDLSFAFSGTAPDFGAFEFVGTTSVEDNLAVDFTTYPNPAHNILYFNQQMISVGIFDMQGRKIIDMHDTKQVDISMLKKGIYLIKLHSENHKTLNTKFIKR